MSPSIAQISTYPPTRCGLGTFARSLTAHLAAAGVDTGIVRVGGGAPDDPVARDSTHVVHEWADTGEAGTARAAHAASTYDVVVLQHEFGIYPGPDGDGVLDLVDGISRPLATVLHTVLPEPSERQRRIVEQLAERSDALVVMSDAGRYRLARHYDLHDALVRVIPHGAVDNRGPAGGSHDRPTVLCWGLLGPGKGLEVAMRAMATLEDLEPRPRLLIVGQVHPGLPEDVRRAYLLMLASTAAELAGRIDVEFDQRYLDSAALRRVVRSADVVLLPYLNQEQVCSGVLIESIAAGRPVVAARFPHATEVLATGAGLTVPPHDPDAMGAALRTVLTEPGAAAAMHDEACRLAPRFLWSRVARQYHALAAELAGASIGRVTA